MDKFNLPDISNLKGHFDKEWLLDRDAAIWGMSLGFATGNKIVTIVAWVIGHYLKMEDLVVAFKEISKPLASRR